MVEKGDRHDFDTCKGGDDCPICRGDNIDPPYWVLRDEFAGCSVVMGQDNADVATWYDHEDALNDAAQRNKE